MRILITLTAILVGMALAGPADAQQAINPANPSTAGAINPTSAGAGVVTRPGLGYVPGYAYGYHGFGGTAAGSYWRGRAAYAHGLGSYNLNTARALSELQRARRQAIQNRQYALQNYFENRQMNEDYRAAKRRPVPSREEIERMNEWANYEPVMANTVAKDGTIHWPPALQAEEYAELRAELEALFQQDMLDPKRVQELTDEMLARLRADIEEIPSSEFVTAKKFLGGLDHEANLGPVNGENLASR